MVILGHFWLFLVILTIFAIFLKTTLHAELWERDRLAKAAREEAEAEDAMNRNYKQLDILQTQRKENAIRAEAAKGNIHTEAQQLQLDREQLQAENCEKQEL